ncbi:Zinc finger ccch domain-containing protein [Thalictrum thalictroides]|uniref:Zinc finger ccch domain-containing protein n=1 Tax=Thalictrum thalictroides TaxID=46969 RepID=A0A7J6X286_THATH|nr:Zinc finger ccch domain-containing protein [Thalictrum thalictroides]
MQRVRDTAFFAASIASILRSDLNVEYNRDYFAENHASSSRAGDYDLSMNLSSGKDRPNDTILKLRRMPPYYKRNIAYVCSFYASCGDCTRITEQDQKISLRQTAHKGSEAEAAVGEVVGVRKQEGRGTKTADLSTQNSAAGAVVLQHCSSTTTNIHLCSLSKKNIHLCTISTFLPFLKAPLIHQWIL